LHGKTEAVLRAPAAVDQFDIGRRQGVMPDEFMPFRWQGEEMCALCSGENPWVWCPSFKVHQVNIDTFLETC